MGYPISKLLWDAIRDLKATRNISDNLALTGHPITMEDLIAQVLAGLDSPEYCASMLKSPKIF